MTELESETERLESRIGRKESRIGRKESELQAFEEEPQAQVDARLSELNDGIEATTDRTPTHPDNRSMHEHLVKLKTGIENDREAFVRWRIANLEREINEIEADLEDLE